MKKYFDSHTHIPSEDSLLVSFDMESSRKACGKLYSVGIHPQHINGADWEELEKLASRPGAAAIGECGLDYRKTDGSAPDRALQQEAFIRQLELASSLKKPVIVHSVKAAADTLSILRRFPDVTAVLHGFPYSPETAREALQLGCFFGIGAIILKPGALKIKEVLKILPDDRILAETDTPFSNASIEEVTEAICALRGGDRLKTMASLRANALRLLTGKDD